MTEQEWLTTHDAYGMTDHLVRRRRNRPSDRKFRLFMCAACRLLWDQFRDSATRQAVETVEQFADGKATPEDVKQAKRNVERSQEIGLRRAAVIWSTWDEWHGHSTLTMAVGTVVAFVGRINKELGINLPRMTRCIFGNPFRPVSVDPSWLTSTVVQLAQGIYDYRAFDRMPILADALQDAGCDNDDVLNHCRDTNTPHARGCWVVDLVLGKA